jgi:hypothetical protein
MLEVHGMCDRLRTKPETREALRIGPRKLDELIKSGDLEVIKLGSRTVRIAESAIRRLVEQRSERRRS